VPSVDIDVKYIACKIFYCGLFCKIFEDRFGYSKLNVLVSYKCLMSEKATNVSFVQNPGSWCYSLLR